jgi:hypothetical protein
MISWLPSPIARRTSLIQRVKDSSVTVTLGQTASITSSLAMTRPACSTRYRSTEAFGSQLGFPVGAEQAHPIEIEGEGRKLERSGCHCPLPPLRGVRLVAALKPSAKLQVNFTELSGLQSVFEPIVKSR